MAMRDLIPWGRQTNTAPVSYRSEENDPFLGLRRDMDRLFDDFFRGTVPSQAFLWNAIGWPNIEVRETDGEVRITAEVPGMSEKDVELFVEDGVLTVRGERKNEKDERDRGYSERFYGRFERRIPLPSGVREEGAKADFQDGVLTVIMPKSAEEERGRRIPINGQTKH